MRFIIIGYRDSYFWNEYGTSVRDLQIAEILSREHEVIFVNRPVSIYERVINKSKKKSIYEKYSSRITFLDSTSYDLIGPVRGRLWTEKCYIKFIDKVIDLYATNFNGKVIIIDFTPLAKINYKPLKNVIYWYDLIDNFAIHNRFSSREKFAVAQKYLYVDKHANFITAVSEKALKSFSNKYKYVMPNGIYIEESVNDNRHLPKRHNNYQLGFVGFITDKFDVDFVNKLAEKYTIIIWGKCFDDKIIQRLDDRIKVAGPFRYNDLPDIMTTFQVGLMPYLAEKSHDESPLKMYEYFKYGIPCLSSMNFEIDSKWFENYSNLSIEKLDDIIRYFLECSHSDDVKKTIREEWMFDTKIKTILSRLK
ncbi:glycosyltransferase family 1 protein [Kosakonia sp. SMBL-WEM22]|uniref:glycosyl transferase n=1 Tax=Kosakonia sp. SMBL-WEM22 TaxID=2725560 RepID=UPI00165938F2|nr:glycosyl transferase [Kosakonia sp. SMBL-WEM22]QNQ20998.1 glycosyltransferase family 1 protein [Kosakonia sp. SMBL-WEM22]